MRLQHFLGSRKQCHRRLIRQAALSVLLTGVTLEFLRYITWVPVKSPACPNLSEAILCIFKGFETHILRTTNCACGMLVLFCFAFCFGFFCFHLLGEPKWSQQKDKPLLYFPSFFLPVQSSLPPLSWFQTGPRFFWEAETDLWEINWEGS